MTVALVHLTKLVETAADIKGMVGQLNSLIQMSITVIVCKAQ